MLVGFAAAAAQQPTPDVVKISTDLIQVDVTVTDQNGKIVKDLGPNDLEIYENGQRQQISSLTFVSGSRSEISVGGNSGSPAGNANQPGGTPAPAGALAGRTIAIVVDDINLSFASVYYTRLALRKFVETQMQHGDLVAILRTSGGVGALQQFTADKTLLLAAIDSIHWNPLGNAPANPLTSVGQNAQDVTDRFNSEGDAMANSAAGDSDPKRMSVHLRANVSDKKATDYNVVANNDESEAAMYAQASIGSIRYVVGAMRDLPGRKTMMLFSDGITVSESSVKSRATFVNQLLEDLVDTANRSSVVVYTFDTRGLQNMEIAASDNTYEVIDGNRSQKVAERTANFKAAQDGLNYVAAQTGGRALLDSNNLNGGMQRALEEQAGYYLIAYVPQGETFDPDKRRFNKLEVKANRPGLHVSYRSGFFVGPGTTTAVTRTPDSDLARALVSPFAKNDIPVAVNALYADDASDGSYLRAFVHIDARLLSFSSEADGGRSASFDVAAAAIGVNGVAVDGRDAKYTIKAKGPAFESILKNGFVYVLIFPVRSAGVLQFRVAIRDGQSGKLGSASQIIQVPNLRDQKLTLSSVAVEDLSLDTWQQLKAGKVGQQSGQMQVASTLLYDTALRQFPANTVLRYGYEVYNARHNGSSMPRLEVQTRVLQNNKPVVAGNPIKFDAAGQSDPSRIRISGQVMLNSSLLPGDYLLQVVVRDAGANATAVETLPFEIIK